MLVEVQNRWEEILKNKKIPLYGDQIVEITFQIDPKDGQYVALKQALGTSQLSAEFLCVGAIASAAPFGEVPKEITPKNSKPLELTIRFLY